VTPLSQDAFRLVVEAAQSGMIMVDQSGTIVLINAQVERLFGYRRDELIGQSIEQLVPARYRARHSGHRDGFWADPHVRAMGAGRDLFGLRIDGTETPC
jgi:PAS domain S-box-containing protein